MSSRECKRCGKKIPFRRRFTITILCKPCAVYLEKNYSDKKEDKKKKK